MALCDICKKVAELGMPCQPINCQCTCHRKTKVAYENARRMRGITQRSVDARIASQIKVNGTGDIGVF